MSDFYILDTVRPLGNDGTRALRAFQNRVDFFQPVANQRRNRKERTT